MAEAGSSFATGDPDLDALGARLFPTLEANRKELEGATGPVRGFGAGTTYPQIWIRDSATLTDLVRWHYPRAYLTSWIEEHLAHQGADGSLNDWVAAGEPSHFTDNAPRARQVWRAGRVVLSADRNTSAGDQEASAVLAAARVFAITGDVAWLRRDVQGRPLLRRLDDALGFVIAHRTDPRTGLPTSAFTADWGDVSPSYGDQRVIYLDEKTPVAAGTYVGALFAGAAHALSRLHVAAGEEEAAEKWEARAEAVESALRRHLWDERRGFFRVHRVTSAPRGWPAPDETDVFAMGGNAVAALLGIASDREAGRIFAAAEARRVRFRLDTVAGVLLPPYPAGTFLHPLQRNAFEYQNGGEWDWWAGRLVLAEFERGHSEAARTHLQQIAARVAKADGLFEWNTQAGEGKGSPAYAGSAGALGAAIYRGLFGIDLRAEGLHLDVRLASNGRVQVEEPATGAHIAYEFEVERSALRLKYRTDMSAPVSVSILLPAGTTAGGIRRDGQPVRTAMIRGSRVGRDQYAGVRGGASTGEIEIHLETLPPVATGCPSGDPRDCEISAAARR